MLRSILSVFAGFAVMTVLIMAATILAARLMLGTRSRADLMKMKPTRAFTAVNLVYSAAFGVLGGFVTAVVARQAPLAHAGALAALMFLMAIFSAVQNRRSTEPKGYSVTLMILGPVAALLGGYLQFLRQAA